MAHLALLVHSMEAKIATTLVRVEEPIILGLVIISVDEGLGDIILTHRLVGVLDKSRLITGRS